jgi:hypothetical protein
VKHQAQYHQRVLTAYKISGYAYSSGKKKVVAVLITVRILIFLQVLVYGMQS